jgi:hypothetical protein
VSFEDQCLYFDTSSLKLEGFSAQKLMPTCYAASSSLGILEARPVNPCGMSHPNIESSKLLSARSHSSPDTLSFQHLQCLKHLTLWAPSTTTRHGQDGKYTPACRTHHFEFGPNRQHNTETPAKTTLCVFCILSLHISILHIVGISQRSKLLRAAFGT